MSEHNKHTPAEEKTRTHVGSNVQNEKNENETEKQKITHETIEVERTICYEIDINR